jgi:hypothetical protein
MSLKATLSMLTRLRPITHCHCGDTYTLLASLWDRRYRFQRVQKRYPLRVLANDFTMPDPGLIITGNTTDCSVSLALAGSITVYQGVPKCTKVYQGIVVLGYEGFSLLA